LMQIGIICLRQHSAHCCFVFSRVLCGESNYLLDTLDLVMFDWRFYFELQPNFSNVLFFGDGIWYLPAIWCITVIKKDFRVDIRLTIRLEDEIHPESNNVFLELLSDRGRILPHNWHQEWVIRQQWRHKRSLKYAWRSERFHDVSCIIWRRIVAGTTTFFVLRSSQSEMPTSSRLPTSSDAHPWTRSFRFWTVRSRDTRGTWKRCCSWVTIFVWMISSGWRRINEFTQPRVIGALNWGVQ
jgi:hypothetical protein